MKPLYGLRPTFLIKGIFKLKAYITLRYLLQWQNQLLFVISSQLQSSDGDHFFNQISTIPFSMVTYMKRYTCSFLQVLIDMGKRGPATSTNLVWVKVRITKLVKKSSIFLAASFFQSRTGYTLFTKLMGKLLKLFMYMSMTL